MFMGEYRHSLDAKNRLIVPAKFREELGDVFVITKGYDGCLALYTEQRWGNTVRQMEELPTLNSDARKYIRMLLSKAQECSFDSQGRIQLPAFLVESIDIQKKCAVIGAADHVEIWAEEKWDEYEQAAAGSFENIAESLAGLMK